MPLIFPSSKIETKYSTGTQSPQYKPTGRNPPVASLYNSQKYGRLVNEIRSANLDEDVEKFLILAASRHVEFNYKQIADFYTSASESVQNLMEKSALVIIDIDDAIMNGYVELSDSLFKIRDKEQS